MWTDHPHVPALERDWLLYVKKPLAVPFISTIILLLVTTCNCIAHSDTSPRDVKWHRSLSYVYQCVRWEPLFSQLILRTQRSWFELVLGSQRKPSPIVTEMLQDWTNIHASPLWQSPGIGKLNSYPLWLELTLTADSRRLRLQQVLRCHSSSKKPSFSPSFFLAQNCRTRNTTEDKDGLKPYTTLYHNRYEEETLWNSPNGTETWYTLLVRGINGRRGGYTQTLLYILSYSVHQAPLYSPHVSVNQVILPSNSMM